MKSTITQVLLFHKRSVYPFPVVKILNPYHVKFCVGKGAVLMVLFFLMLFFSKQELKPKSFSCQTHIILKNIFMDNISSTFFLFRFARDFLPGLLKEATFVVCGSVVLHD